MGKLLSPPLDGRCGACRNPPPSPPVCSRNRRVGRTSAINQHAGIKGTHNTVRTASLLFGLEPTGRGRCTSKAGCLVRPCRCNQPSRAVSDHVGSGLGWFYLWCDWTCGRLGADVRLPQALLVFLVRVGIRLRRLFLVTATSCGMEIARLWDASDLRSMLR